MQAERVDSCTSSLWTGLFLIKGASDQFLLLPCFIEIHVFNANSVDPDQMPGSILFANVPFMGLGIKELSCKVWECSFGHVKTQIGLFIQSDEKYLLAAKGRLSSGPYFSLFFLCSYFSLLFFSKNALLALYFSPKMFEVTKICIFFFLGGFACSEFVKIWAQLFKASLA